MSFWNELKRRNVYKVAVAYLIVAWLILQVVSIVFPMFHMPAWTSTFMAVLLIVGFPLVLIFAWAFEITPEGLKRTHEVPHNESITHLTGQKLNFIVIGLLVIAVAYILFDNLYLDKRVTETEVASRVAELASPAVNEEEAVPAIPTIEEEESSKTIAVLPFVNMSSDSEQDYFADGLSEEILNSLNKIPGLLVTARTSSFAFKGKDLTVQDIAPVLGVANILEGSVRKAGNKLRVTAQLIRASDGFHLWSEQYDRELKDIEDILSIQGDIAKNVANELKITLGVEESLRQIGGTDNLEAYELYLAAKAQSSIIQIGQRPFESIIAALDLDPEFALAWALKASISNLPGVQDQSLNEDLEAAQKAIDIEPNLPEAYAALGSCRMNRGDWIGAEMAYHKAHDLGTLSTLIDGNYIPFLFAVGYLGKANQILGEALRNDPLSQRICDMYRNSFIYLGDRQRAEEVFNRYISMFDPYGDFNIRINFGELSLDDIISQLPFSKEERERIKSPEDFLDELRNVYTDLPTPVLLSLSVIAAYLDDPELALKIREITIHSDPALIDGSWYPIMHEVRQLPRFKELVREIGLVDYWEQFGYPDLCRTTDDGDFECD